MSNCSVSVCFFSLLDVQANSSLCLQKQLLQNPSTMGVTMFSPELVDFHSPLVDSPGGGQNNFSMGANRGRA